MFLLSQYRFVYLRRVLKNGIVQHLFTLIMLYIFTCHNAVFPAIISIEIQSNVDNSTTSVAILLKLLKN